MSFKLLYTSDFHGNKEFYKKLVDKSKEDQIKAVVIGGDLCPRGGNTTQEAIQYQKEFLESYFILELKKLKKDVFFIMGNDDFRANETLFDEESNLKYINKKRFTIFSKNIVGYSFVNPTPFRLKDWEKIENNKAETPNQMFDHVITSMDREEGTIEEDLKNFKKLSNPKKTIYVMHAPPFNTKLDVIHDTTHVGSKAIRQFIETEQPYLTLHGHIHESSKMSGSFVDKIGDTICVNVGSSYPENKLNAVVIDLSNLDVKYVEL